MKKGVSGCNMVLKRTVTTGVNSIAQCLKTQYGIESYGIESFTYKVRTTSQPDYLHNLMSVQCSVYR